MKKRNLTKIVFVLLPIMFFAIGFFLFFYPIVSNYLEKKNQATVIQEYEEEVKNESQDKIQQKWNAAKKYNENLTGEYVQDPFLLQDKYDLSNKYLDILNINGIMGYIDIPKINVHIPIYHGSSKDVLEKGIGHLESTALPIGGASTHSILTGHRGLPSSRLFTDLDKLKIGDLFYIQILDEVHAYKVDRIDTIKPDELKKLTIYEGEDYITLITCTPYGINTHRLLVRGSRTEYIPEEREIPKSGFVEVMNIDKYQIIGITIGIVLLIIILILILVFIELKRKKDKEEKNEEIIGN